MTIAQTIRTALSQGLNTEEVLAVVKANHPNSNTSAACVAYYRSKMKKEGKVTAPAAAVEPTRPQVDNFKAVVDFMNANIDLLGYIWARWQDEKEYEDISEYGAAIAKKFPADAGWKVVKTTKRPLGVVIAVGAEQFHLCVTAQRVYTKKLK